MTLEKRGFVWVHLHIFFLIANTTVYYDPKVVKTGDVELWIQGLYIWRADYKFSTGWRVGAPNPHVIRGSAVLDEVLGTIDTQINGGSFYIDTLNI